MRSAKIDGEYLVAKFAAKFAGEVCPAKCRARHPAKDAAKFRRNFVRVELELLSRKFHRNSTANFTAIKSQTHQAQENADRLVRNRSGPWGFGGFD